ncbi:MAG: hypothetical protein LE180_01890 [Endomicrobium sp.]|uniref:hypothetical protein n=1 Tax=Candidatus Endomicrobiellum pyrsonymphae TaxID=1408203 RepID=UPI00357E2F74|nr:hypothetical protein [Endomicrobium sp.]
MKNDIINNAISSVLAKQEVQDCPISKAFMKAIQEYVRLGYNLSELSWFKGLNFESIENSPLQKAV